MGIVAPWHVEFSRTRDQTHVLFTTEPLGKPTLAWSPLSPCKMILHLCYWLTITSISVIVSHQVCGNLYGSHRKLTHSSFTFFSPLLKYFTASVSCLVLSDSLDCNPPDSSIHGIFQAGILERVAISYSRGSSWPPGIKPKSPAPPTLAGWFFTTAPPGKPFYSKVKWSEVTQSRPTLCDPMDCSLPGIFQAIVLEWGDISFSSGSSRPRDGTQVSCIVDRRFTVWATREVHFSKLLSHWVVPFSITLVSFVVVVPPCLTACRISVLQSEAEPRPWQWKPRILTTRPPGNSPSLVSLANDL